MRLELTIEELGQALKKIEKDYKLNMMVKSELSGGWLTMTGETEILQVPHIISTGCAPKGNNIISMKIKDNSNEGSIVKLTGVKNKTFNVDICAGRYKEISKVGLSIDTIKTNENECKFRIDENIIFTIKENADKIFNLIQSK